MKGVVKRGGSRVKVGANCKRGEHGECTVQDCLCACHGERGQ